MNAGFPQVEELLARVTSLLPLLPCPPPLLIPASTFPTTCRLHLQLLLLLHHPRLARGGLGEEQRNRGEGLLQELSARGLSGWLAGIA